MAKRRLVIGFNDSPQGADALELGRALAEALDAVPVVAVVVDYPTRGEPEQTLDEFCAPMFETARESMDGLRVIERPLAAASVGRALHDLAEELNPVTFVLGSAHHGPGGRVLTGSVARSLLSGSPCGIAVAPHGYAARAGDIGTIGVAVDGSVQSLRALSGAAMLADGTGASIRVLTVDEPHHYALGGALSPLSSEEFEQRKHGEAEQVLADALEKVPDGVEAESILLEGAAADALADAAGDIDLLLLGSRGYGVLKGAVLGSVSAKLMVNAPCPVLILPHGSGADPLGA